MGCGRLSGISSNKTLAKMASKTHKPSKQTLLLKEHRRCFLADKPLRSLPGIGEEGPPTSFVMQAALMRGSEDPDVSSEAADTEVYRE